LLDAEISDLCGICFLGLAQINQKRTECGYEIVSPLQIKRDERSRFKVPQEIFPAGFDAVL